MSYVRQTGRDYARRRRQRRSQIILAVMAAIVVCGFAWAVAYASGWLPGSGFSAGGPSCTVSVTKPPQSRVQVNVYNASTTSGRANEVWHALQSRGFTVGAVSNDPNKEHVTGAGQIRVGPDGEQFARAYLLPLIPGAQVVVDGRDDSSVDVVIGDQFPTLNRVTQSAQSSGPCATVTH